MHLISTYKTHDILVNSAIQQHKCVCSIYSIVIKWNARMGSEAKALYYVVCKCVKVENNAMLMLYDY